jgi:hypothetical protein
MVKWCGLNVFVLLGNGLSGSAEKVEGLCCFLGGCFSACLNFGGMEFGFGDLVFLGLLFDKFLCGVFLFGRWFCLWGVYVFEYLSSGV